MRTITLDVTIIFTEMDDDYSPEMAVENLHDQLQEAGVSFDVDDVKLISWEDDETGELFYESNL